MRILTLFLIGLGAVALAVAPSVVEAANPPTVTAVIEGQASNTGRGTLFVAGTKLQKFKTFSVLEDGVVVSAPRLLVKGKSLITLELSDGLAPGSYTLRLEPKGRRGEPLDVPFTYLTARNTFSSDLAVAGGARVDGNVGIGRPAVATLDVLGTARVSNTTARFDIFNFAPNAGTVLTAAFASAASGVGPQLRFADLDGSPFIDVGQNGAGDFVIENQSDQAVLTVRQNGSSAFRDDVTVGPQFGSAQLHVNGPIFSDGTVGITAKDDSSAILSLNREDGSQVVRVGSFGTVFMEMTQGNAFKPGGGSWGVFSDRRLKKNVVTLEGSLEKLMKLRSVEFEYKDPKSLGEREGRNVGFVAQEVEPIFPEWVGEKHDGMKYVAFTGFESLTVAALRELRAEKDAQIEELRAQNTELADRLAALESALDGLRSAPPASDDDPTSPDAR